LARRVRAHRRLHAGAPRALTTQKKTTIEVKICADTDEQTYVLCRSEQRIAKDRAIRSKQGARLLADIEKLSLRVANKKLVKPEKINQAIGRLLERYPRVARYYRLSHDEKTATLVSTFDADKHLTAEKLDGCYLLKTDRKDLTADEIWRVYTLLTRAEDAFRDMKSPLVIRPIFHHKERRTDSHIFLSLLAYHLLTAIACSSRASTPPGRACVTLSKLIRSAASSFPPKTTHVCASARPPRQNPTSSRSIATSQYSRTSSPQNTPGPSLQIVAKPRPIPLIRNNFVFRELEVGLGCFQTYVPKKGSSTNDPWASAQRPLGRCVELTRKQVKAR
jgi:hypothetical protein